jgi:trk system potassium uptake protein TrkA
MKVIIVGCGRTGAGLAKKLSSEGHFVTVIDSDPAAFELLGSSIRSQNITGLGFDRDVLAQAKIERTDALAAVTSSDEANVIIARLAKDVFHVPRVVAKLCGLNKAEVYQRLGLETIDPTTWGIDRISEVLLHSPLETLKSVGNGAVEIVEFEVPAQFAGHKVAELNVPGEFQVIAVSHVNKTVIPAPDAVLQEKDVIHLAVEQASRDHLRTLLGLE